MRRTVKTAEYLAESLRSLMQDAPIEKIPIKSITENCGLNRQTFYYHFKDIYDLLKWMYLRDIEEAIRKVNRAGDIEGLLKEFLSEIDKDRAFHIAIYKSANYYPMLRREFSDIAVKVLLPVFQSRFDVNAYDAEYQDFLIRMYALVLFEFVERSALDMAVSSPEGFARYWARCLEEQFLGAPMYRARASASNTATGAE